MFQKCPICKGKGTLKESSCPVCLGERIINKDSGLPPSKIFIPTVPYYPFVPYYPIEPQYPVITYIGKGNSGIEYSSPTFTN